MLTWLKQFMSPSAPTTAEAPALPAPARGDDGPGDHHHFVSDEPIDGAAQDRFNRAPFAKRIADTIARRPDSSSLVIGVFGPWGDGKTSVLKMMEEALEQYDDVVVIRFNPWHFQSEDQLVKGFFNTLAAGLDQKLHNVTERIGQAIGQYGSLLSLASVTLAGAVALRPGDAAKGLGEAMSNVSLDTLKSRIEGFLVEAGKRVVILVDDIDRLDRNETHSIFKLVKLSASFKQTAYVLAFDDEIVSAALGERYGAGGQAAGRAFLEKIVQVPLHLPPTERLSIRSLASEGIDAALRVSEIALGQEDVDAFGRHFIDGLEPAMKTPRVAKLYTNALLFALPLLKGDVNIMNLMLLEGIRVLYPRLYAAIRDNPALFLKAPERRNHSGQDVTSPLDQLIETALGTLTPGEREAVRVGLIKPLFPRTGTMGYGPEWDSIWAGQKKVCAERYFRRYFAYAVPNGDLSDARIRAVIGDAVEGNHDAVRERLDAIAEQGAAAKLIEALYDSEPSLTLVEAEAVANAIARNGHFLPRERGPMIVTTRMHASFLVAKLLGKLPNNPERAENAQQLVQAAEPLPFAVELLRALRYSAKREPAENIFGEPESQVADRTLAVRIARAHSEQPIYTQFPADTPHLLWQWGLGDATQATASLIRRFDQHPEEMDAFIDSFIVEGWVMETGQPVRGWMRRETYDAIVDLVPAGYVLDNLRARFGAEIDTPSHSPDDGWTRPRKLAHNFADVHAHVAGSVVDPPSPTQPDSPSDQ
jgi:KAP family P-loop domain